MNHFQITYLPLFLTSSLIVQLHSNLASSELLNIAWNVLALAIHGLTLGHQMQWQCSLTREPRGLDSTTCLSSSSNMNRIETYDSLPGVARFSFDFAAC